MGKTVEMPEIADIYLIWKKTFLDRKPMKIFNKEKTRDNVSKNWYYILLIFLD